MGLFRLKASLGCSLPCFGRAGGSDSWGTAADAVTGSRQAADSLEFGFCKLEGLHQISQEELSNRIYKNKFHEKEPRNFNYNVDTVS